tara:strand:+ start:2224 stop:2889 length:666 start_codon:yes stop_codon:yes gene_type:complete
MIKTLKKKIKFPKGYHNFVDKRSFLGIPNFFDVMSNFAILLPALYLLKTRKKVSLMSNLLIIHISLLALSSGYYHLHPSEKTIFWDIMFISTSYIIVFITVNTNDNPETDEDYKEELLLYTYSVFAIIYWKYTSDLKFYALLLVGVPLYIVFKYYNSDNNRIKLYLLIMVISNILLRLSEYNDKYIYKISYKFVSGHTLKHIFVGLGLFSLINILQIDNKL